MELTISLDYLMSQYVLTALHFLHYQYTWRINFYMFRQKELIRPKDQRAKTQVGQKWRKLSKKSYH